LAISEIRSDRPAPGATRAAAGFASLGAEVE
jgi:hypothetical protein